jgi:glyoxylase-like metal-dependent hydrolase (beta-lactamase superfamily II)
MNQIPISQSASAEHPEADERRDDKTRQIAVDVAYRQIAIVNVIFFGRPDAGDRRWVLIDAGIAGSASAIRSAARARFGQGARPSAIILTHCHFDHVGALETLAAEWDVPVYAHAGASISQWNSFLSAGRSYRRRRRHGSALPAISDAPR